MDEFLISELFLNYKGEKNERRHQGEDGEELNVPCKEEAGNQHVERTDTETSGQALSV